MSEEELQAIGEACSQNVASAELFSEISKNDLTGAWEAEPSHKVHPVCSLLRGACAPPGSRRHVRLLNTAYAAAEILRSGGDALQEWLRRKLKTAIMERDLEVAASHIGEVRAAGYLLHAPLAVQPFKAKKGSKSPDFQCKDWQDDSITVEVATKLMHGPEAQKMAASLSGGAANTPTVVHPAGPPGPGENVTVNAAHKIAGHSKFQKNQAVAGLPHVVWLDFQDDDAFGWENELDLLEIGRGLHIDGPAVFAGGIWLGLYGERDQPVLEAGDLIRGTQETAPLPFEGGFRQAPWVSAAVVSLPNRTAVFVSPWADVGICNHLQEALLQLPKLDYRSCMLSWPGVDLEAEVANRIALARAIETRLAEIERQIDRE